MDVHALLPSRAAAALAAAALVLPLAASAAGCRRAPEPTFQRGEGAEAPAEGATGAGGAPAAGAPQGVAVGEPNPSAPGGAPAAPAAPTDARLLAPSELTARAPDTYAVELRTTEGPVVVDVTRDWSPQGADRFYNLVKAGFYDDVAFFRVIDGFMAQTGLHGDPAVNAAWRGASIPDDPPAGQSNTRGMVSFAMAGPNTRTTQIFVNLVDNTRLDSMGFTPFGKVRDMAAVDKLHAGYGEGAPGGAGPMQARIQREGNAYLRRDFPELDYIEAARVLEGDAAAQ